MPALFEALGIGFSVLIAPTADFDSPWAIVGVAFGFLLFAPIYGVLLAPSGLLIGAWAVRFGIARWAASLLASTVLPAVIIGIYKLMVPEAFVFGVIAIVCPVMLVHAMAMWIVTRHLCLQALYQTPSQTPLP